MKSLPLSIKVDVLERDNWNCQWCKIDLRERDNMNVQALHENLILHENMGCLHGNTLQKSPAQQSNFLLGGGDLNEETKGF